MLPIVCPPLALMLTQVDFQSLLSDTVTSGLYILAVIMSKHALCFFFSYSDCLLKPNLAIIGLNNLSDFFQMSPSLVSQALEYGNKK